MKITRRSTGIVLAEALLLGALSACVPPAAAGGSGSCLREHPEAREVVTAFLDSPVFSDDAAAFGMSPADTLQMRLLADPDDTAACARLVRELATSDVAGYPYVHSFYQVRGHYLIGIGLHPDAGTRVNPNGTLTVDLRRSYVTVADSTFQAVRSFAL